MTAPPTQSSSTGSEPATLEHRLSGLLTAMTTIAAVVVIIGITMLLFANGGSRADFSSFREADDSLRSPAGILGAIQGSSGLRPLAIIQTGVLLLVLTPVARVAFTLLTFVRQRDAIYVASALIVLSVLIYGLAGGEI